MIKCATTRTPLSCLWQTILQNSAPLCQTLFEGFSIWPWSKKNIFRAPQVVIMNAVSHCLSCRSKLGLSWRCMIFSFRQANLPCDDILLPLPERGGWFTVLSDPHHKRNGLWHLAHRQNRPSHIDERLSKIWHWSVTFAVVRDLVLF